jgi:hypothetical protein
MFWIRDLVGGPPVEHNISRLVELAKSVKFDEQQRLEQRKSFVYGNVKIENDRVTHEMVEAASRKIEAPGE